MMRNKEEPFNSINNKSILDSKEEEKYHISMETKKQKEEMKQKLLNGVQKQSKNMKKKL